MSRKSKSAKYAGSRRRRNLILVFVIALLVAAVVLDRAFYKSSRNAAPVGTQAGRISDFDKYHGGSFKVVRVVDGDTIDIGVPDADKPYTRIRLWGVDSPETQKSPSGPMYFGKEASEFVRQLVLGEMVTVYLDEGNNTRGKYGRLLAYVQLEDDRFLNELLLIEGYAYADLRFDHSFYNKYKQLEATARSMNKGLWRDVKREQLPAWLKREKPQLLK